MLENMNKLKIEKWNQHEQTQNFGGNIETWKNGQHQFCKKWNIETWKHGTSLGKNGKPT